MLDPQGYIAECTGENLFMVRKGVIYTPPEATILAGITRDSVIALAKNLGMPFKETTITRDQLYIADEVFISGTAAEIVGVRAIDYRTIGEGRPGAITRSLSEAFYSNVRGEGAYSEEWLDYVEEIESQPIEH